MICLLFQLQQTESLATSWIYNAIQRANRSNIFCTFHWLVLSSLFLRASNLLDTCDESPNFSYWQLFHSRIRWHFEDFSFREYQLHQDLVLHLFSNSLFFFQIQRQQFLAFPSWKCKVYLFFRNFTAFQKQVSPRFTFIHLRLL